MMITEILNMLFKTFVVLMVILGVAAVLVSIKCGSGYLFRHEKDDTAELRKEVNHGHDGISSHNIFYRFFFRGGN